jgi:hypothetical protein
MKYIKSYNENKVHSYDSMDTEDLEELLHWSRIEYNELGDKIRDINAVLTKRKEEGEESHSKSLPVSIFDFNKEQCDWIFEHGHGTTSKKYNISNKYFEQLKGFFTSGFNPDTNQFAFKLSKFYFDNTDLDLIIKSMKFLGDNLKRVNYTINGEHKDIVQFGVQYEHLEDYDHKVNYVSENELYLVQYRTKKFDSIKSLIDYIISIDNE